MFGCVGFVSAVNRGGWICLFFFIIACCEWKNRALCSNGKLPTTKQTNVFIGVGGGGLFG